MNTSENTSAIHSLTDEELETVSAGMDAHMNFGQMTLWITATATGHSTFWQPTFQSTMSSAI
jgi:hypothetical protein